MPIFSGKVRKYVLYPEPNMHQRQQFAAIITTFLFGYAIMSL
jgi:hypothetical protein